MKLSQISAYVGGFTSLLYIAQSCISIISNGNEVATELVTQLPLMAVCLLPAFVIFYYKNFTPIFEKISVLYPILIIVGLGNAYFASDPLAAGLPMVVLVFPVLILLSILLASVGRSES